MKNISIHIPSAAVGVAFGLLGPLALGVQSFDATPYPGPHARSVVLPPLPFRSLEFLPVVETVADATQADVLRVRAGERFAVMGPANDSSAGFQVYSAVRWPPSDSNGDGDYDSLNVNINGNAVPDAYLPPGDYIFVDRAAVGIPGTGRRQAEGVHGYRVPH